MSVNLPLRLAQWDSFVRQLHSIWELAPTRRSRNGRLPAAGLIVDAEKHRRQSLQFELISCGHKVITCSNLLIGMRLISRTRWDFVVAADNLIDGDVQKLFDYAAAIEIPLRVLIGDFRIAKSAHQPLATSIKLAQSSDVSSQIAALIQRLDMLNRK